MSFAFGVPFAMLLFLLLSFQFLTLILVAFLVGTICCFVSKFSTVSTTSFEGFLGPFFVGGTCKEGIIIFLFFPALSIVEKPLFSIGLISSCADQYSSCALLQSKIACLQVSFTAYEYFYKLSKSASFSQWLLHPVTQKNQ